jgi:hypothetical protein
MNEQRPNRLVPAMIGALTGTSGASGAALTPRRDDVYREEHEAGRQARAAGLPLDACPWSEHAEDRDGRPAYANTEARKRSAWRRGWLTGRASASVGG